MKQILYFFIVLLLGFNLGIAANHTANCTSKKFEEGFSTALIMVKKSKIQIKDNYNAVIIVDSTFKIPVKIYYAE